MTALDNNYLKSNSLFLDGGVNGEYLHERSMESQQRQSGRRGVISRGIVLIFHFCPEKHDTLLLLHSNCAQGKASAHPAIVSLKT